MRAGSLWARRKCNNRGGLFDQRHAEVRFSAIIDAISNLLIRAYLCCESNARSSILAFNVHVDVRTYYTFFLLESSHECQSECQSEVRKTFLSLAILILSPPHHFLLQSFPLYSRTFFSLANIELILCHLSACSTSSSSSWPSSICATYSSAFSTRACKSAPTKTTLTTTIWKHTNHLPSGSSCIQVSSTP